MIALGRSRPSLSSRRLRYFISTKAMAVPTPARRVPPLTRPSRRNVLNLAQRTGKQCPADGHSSRFLGGKDSSRDVLNTPSHHPEHLPRLCRPRNVFCNATGMEKIDLTTDARICSDETAEPHGTLLDDFLEQTTAAFAEVPPTLKVWRDFAEVWRIDQALRACAGNRSAAARQLGIGRRTLYTKMEKLGIELG